MPQVGKLQETVGSLMHKAEDTNLSATATRLELEIKMAREEAEKRSCEAVEICSEAHDARRQVQKLNEQLDSVCFKVRSQGLPEGLLCHANRRCEMFRNLTS